MNPWLLAQLGIPAVLGGIQGYQSSGGDLGKTAQGALTGGLLGGATSLIGSGASRMAGNALGLGNTALGKSLAAKANAGTLSLPETMLYRAPAVANIGTQLVTGAALAPAANAVSNLAGQVFSGAGKLAGPAVGAGTTIAQQQQQNRADVQNQLDQTQALSRLQQQQNQPISLTDVYTGRGATAREAERLEAGLQRNERVKDFLAYLPLNEQVKKNELDRLMAAAQIRQNIATGADMLQSGYRTSQQIGANAASQLGQALSAQYQYS